MSSPIRKISRRLQSVMLSIGLSFTLTGCANVPHFQDGLAANQTNETDPNKGFSDPGVSPTPPAFNPTTPDVCASAQTYSGSFTPHSIRGANIVFLIDDSASMNSEIQWVINEVGRFISRILTATQNHFRILLVYDYQKSAFEGVTFRTANGSLIDSTAHPNPLDYLIDNQNVFYFKKETWSKWADIAFFQVFAQTTFSQPLPSEIPVDAPPFGAKVYLPSECSGSGKYFRPRYAAYGDNNFNNTGACFLSTNHEKIENYLLKDTSVNFIALSDDDLNVNFDRAHFDLTDASQNGYPEIIHNSLTELIRPLGQNIPYLYHSIVGLPSSNTNISNVGAAHLALTKKTSGFYHDIEDQNYQTAFDGIADKVIFSEQVVSLSCPLTDSKVPEVLLNGHLLTRDQFSYVLGEKTLRLSPSVFSAMDIDTSFTISVSY